MTRLHKYFLGYYKYLSLAQKYIKLRGRSLKILRLYNFVCLFNIMKRKFIQFELYIWYISASYMYHMLCVGVFSSSFMKMQDVVFMLINLKYTPLLTWKLSFSVLIRVSIHEKLFTHPVAKWRQDYTWQVRVFQNLAWLM